MNTKLATSTTVAHTTEEMIDDLDTLECECAAASIAFLMSDSDEDTTDYGHLDASESATLRVKLTAMYDAMEAQDAVMAAFGEPNSFIGSNDETSIQRK